MIKLKDAAWREIKGNYSGGSHVAELLDQAYSGAPLDKWYEDLFQELCHQYTVSEAAYAAAPHLVRIAAVPGAPRLEILLLLGACFAYASSPIPPGLEDDWHETARAAIPLTAGLLAVPIVSADELRNLLMALAAFHGYHSLAQAIEVLEFDAAWGRPQDVQ